MNLTKNLFLTSIIVLSTLTIFSCKTKKLVVKPAPIPVEKPIPPVAEKVAEPVPEKVQEQVVEKPNFNLDNIQFEFNSFVLKTASLPILDKAVAEMKKHQIPNSYFMATLLPRVHQNIICLYLLIGQMQ